MPFIRNACLMVTVLLVLLGVATSAQAQSCSNPAGVTGDIIYNASDDVFQGCTPSGWMAFHQIPPDPCTVSATAGTLCADGQTVYAGSWAGNRYYTTIADQTAGSRYGTHNVLLGANAQSVSDGWTNTNTALASIDANPQAGGCSASPYNPPACALNAPVLCRDLRTTLGGIGMCPRAMNL